MDDRAALLKDIKARLSLSSIIRPVVELRGRGDSLIGLCPFHQEKTPSFHVRDGMGRFKCFGCGASGDAFEFLMRIRGIGFIDAVSELAEKAGLKSPKNPVFKESRTPGTSDLLQAQKIAQEFFWGQWSLEASKQARRYLLKDRGMSEKMIEQAGIGFGGTSTQSFITHLKKRGVLEKTAFQAGLLKQGPESKLSHFLSRITFPIREPGGQIIAFGGRSIGGEAVGGPKYVNTHSYVHYEKRKSFYGLFESKASIQKGLAPIIVEGYFDAMALWALGMPALALCGTAFSTEHVSVLQGLTARVHLCFDQDDAGVAALKKALPMLFLKNMSADLIVLKEKDPGDYLGQSKLSELKIEVSKPYDALGFLIEQAGIFASANIHDRVKQIDELMPIFASIRRPLLRRQYVAFLAKSLHEDSNLLWQEIEKQTKRALTKNERHKSGHKEDRSLTAKDRLFFEIVLADPWLFADMADVLVQASLLVKETLEVVSISMIENTGQLLVQETKDAIAQANRACGPIFEDALENRTALSKEEAAQALSALKAQLKERETRETLRHKRQELQRLEKTGDFSLVLKNLEEQSQLSKKAHSQKERVRPYLRQGEPLESPAKKSKTEQPPLKK